MLSKTLEGTLNLIFVRAREHNHEFITIEHLLLGLLDDGDTSQVLTACGASIDRLRATLDIFIEETTPHFMQAANQQIQPTQSFQRVLQRAIDQVRAVGQREVTGSSVLVAIYGEPESQAVYFLNQENVLFSDVMSYITQDMYKTQSAQPDLSFGESNSSSGSEESFEFGVQTKEQSKEQEIIEQFTENLNEKARQGKIDPLIGRDHELQRAIQVLCRRSKNNPMLIGEAGVGKTAIAEGLAQMIVNNGVPDALADATIYSLDMASLLAGTKYRGDFEKRFKSVLGALSAENDAIIFIDEIHNIVGAGSATGSTMDASNLLKPLLSSGEIRCMGATTYEEYRTYIEKDNALLRRFQKLEIVEPSVEDALHILEGLREQFESYHHIEYTDAALQRAVELSARYMVDRQLPDKAIDVIDEAGAYQRMQPIGKRCKVIDTSEVEAVIAKITRVPIEKLSGSERDTLKLLPEKIKRKVYGQDHAIDVLSDAINLSYAGLRDPNKPVGSFLLAGPTGVGKTEVVKQLSEELGVELLRFDMSEYMEAHTVSRLIGAPPGYVGHDQAGLLTEKVMKNPHSIVLLDEIEKAHPDVFNILLQVMDYGFLTDNNGRKADFRHVVIVMTSNVGATAYEKATIGFSNADTQEDKSLDAAKLLFTPEFRNRLDAIVPFAPLNETTILRVVDKCIDELQGMLADKSVELTVSDAARNWLAERGYDRAMGARPMARLVQEELKKPLAHELLFGELNDAYHTVTVDVGDDGLLVQIDGVQQAA